MRGSLRQTIVIGNNGSAGGTVAHGRTARAPPNGYTLSLGHTATHVLNGVVYVLPYEVLKDFEPTSLVSTNLQEAHFRARRGSCRTSAAHRDPYSGIGPRF